MGEPFLKAYYTAYNIKEEMIGFVRVADKTHDRYNVADETRHNPRCTNAEILDENKKDRVQ
jgi:hypothetical protein